MRKSKPITGDYGEILDTIRENPGIEKYKLLEVLCKNPTMRGILLVRINELVDSNQIRYVESGAGPLSIKKNYYIKEAK